MPSFTFIEHLETARVNALTMENMWLALLRYERIQLLDSGDVLKFIYCIVDILHSWFVQTRPNDFVPRGA